jgi:plasmid stabilization system protein ParE
MAQLVTTSPRAQLQTYDILDYLNGRNPAAGRRLTERFEAAYRQLSEFPPSGARGRAGTRRLIVSPYVLTYRITAAGVEILDIRHGRQRPVELPEDV